MSDDAGASYCPPRPRLTGRSYPCTYPGCNKSFTKPCKLQEHGYTHTGERPFVCPIPGCDKAYRRSTHLAAHCRTHETDPVFAKPFVCQFEDCGKRFGSRQHLTRHAALHDIPKSMVCTWPNCLASFAKRHQLRTHMTTHTGKRAYPCNVDGCEFSFDSAHKLTKHTETVHNDEPRYLCGEPGCTAKFSKWTGLQEHMKEHPRICEDCGKTFARLGLLTRHRRTVHAPRVSCPWEGCTQTLATTRSLRMHIQLVHERSARFTCTHEECDKTFPYLSLRIQHEKSHTRERVPRSPKRTVPALTAAEALTGHHYKDPAHGRVLACPFEGCEHRYATTYLLERHLASAAHRDDVAQFTLSHPSMAAHRDNLHTTAAPASFPWTVPQDTPTA